MLSMNRHSFVSLHSLLALDQLPQKRREFKGGLSQKTEDAFGITYMMMVACLLISGAQGVQKQTQTFTTMVSALFRLREWLKAQRCEAVAMESMGVYWKCIWNVLEGEMELLLCNAQHIKAVPGRKTASKDAEWIADLLQHGLLRASCVPGRPQRELRDLTRSRSSLAAERARLESSIQKTLEDTNIKLASVATDSTGKSARAILEALLRGEQNPQQLA